MGNRKWLKSYANSLTRIAERYDAMQQRAQTPETKGYARGCAEAYRAVVADISRQLERN